MSQGGVKVVARRAQNKVGRPRLGWAVGPAPAQQLLPEESDRRDPEQHGVSSNSDSNSSGRARSGKADGAGARARSQGNLPSVAAAVDVVDRTFKRSQTAIMHIQESERHAIDDQIKSRLAEKRAQVQNFFKASKSV